MQMRNVFGNLRSVETFLFRLICLFIIYMQKVAENVMEAPGVLMVRRLFI